MHFRHLRAAHMKVYKKVKNADKKGACKDAVLAPQSFKVQRMKKLLGAEFTDDYSCKLCELIVDGRFYGQKCMKDHMKEMHQKTFKRILNTVEEVGEVVKKRRQVKNYKTKRKNFVFGLLREFVRHSELQQGMQGRWTCRHCEEVFFLKRDAQRNNLVLKLHLKQFHPTIFLEIKEDLRKTVYDDETIDDTGADCSPKSVVHKQYNQDKSVGEDGLTSWTSNCKHCEVTFPHKEVTQLQNHLKYHHVEIYKLVIRLDKRALKRHQKKQEDALIGNELATEKYKIHKSSVHEEFVYTEILVDGITKYRSECKHCDKKFAISNGKHCSTAQKHLEAFHPEVLRKVKMKDIDALDESMQRAYDKYDTEFVCEICSKEFKMRLTYEKHMNIHDQERNKKSTEMCPHCGEEFRYLDNHIKRTQCNIPEHERTKVVSKDFMCEYCNKAFGTEGGVNYHIKNVHKDKHLFCDLCDYKTHSKNNLRIHVVRVHEKRDLYVQCSLCNKKCTNLEWHMQVYHKEGV